MKPDIIGINCATGPVEMSEHLRHLSQHARMPISCIPNAGLPSVVDGHMHYDLTPDGLAEHHRRFVTELGIEVIGGCCGTTPAHLKAVVDTCRDLERPARHPEHEAGATSIYSMVPFEQDTSFMIIGERTNANGSKKFREAMLDTDWDTTVAMSKDQVKEGAHVLDVCVDYVGRDGTLDMDEVASRFATQASVPLVLDSTEPQVMEAGLQWLGGRAILNSANLEDGEAPGSRLDRVFKLAREYGAAVICLLIDEEGQARDVEWKLRIAHRIHDLAVDRYGLEPTDLIFDALTFPLSTGDDDLRADAMITIDAIKRIKAEMPGVHTTLGVSNVSFGLKPAARHVLNSMFLHECVQAGLDSAIVHAARIMPLNRIPEEQQQVCLDLIYDRRRPASADAPAYDPLQTLLAVFEDVNAAEVEVEDRSDWTIEQLLSQRIIDGDRENLEVDLDAAMAAGITPLAIINDVLLAGMKVVGDLFGSGQMQLPFVLQSAETMKASVAYLEPYMEKDDSGGKGRIVLATVKGDVHDIGKNLVDIILTNNGYEVHNLGIKISIAEMIEKAQEVKADAIGMSGLLVKSTLIMRDNLEELNSRGLAELPVLLGGAALTRTYVERDLREIYEGRLFYGKDAFEGLHVMDRLGELKRGTGEADDPSWGREPSESKVASRLTTSRDGAGADDVERPARSPEVEADNPVFVPPFLGSKVVKGIPLDDIAAYINETALFRNQWQFRPEKGADGTPETDDEFKVRIRPILRSAAGRGQGGRHARAPARLRVLRGQQRGRRPRHLEGRGPHVGVAALLLSPPEQGAVAEHRRLRATRGVRRGRLRRLPHRHHGPTGERRHGPTLRRGQVPGVPSRARARRRDGRGAGRVLAPPHPRGVGLRRRGRAQPGRALPPAVPGRALLVGLPRLPRSRGQREGGRAPRRRAHRHRGQRGDRVPVPARADDFGDPPAPPQGQVLRRPLGTARTVTPPLQPGARRDPSGARRRDR